MTRHPHWVRYVEGTDGGAATAPADTTPEPDNPTPNEPAPRDTDTTSDDKTSHPWDNPEDARRVIEELRAENARDRVNAKEKAANDARAETVDKIMTALGLKDTGDDQAPEDKINGLTEELSRERLQAQQAQLELAIYRAAGGHGADPDRLLDSRAFIDSVKDLDPTNLDAISEAIKTAVDKNKTYRKPQAGHTANRSDHAPGGQTPAPETMTDAVANYYNQR